MRSCVSADEMFNHTMVAVLAGRANCKIVLRIICFDNLIHYLHILEEEKSPNDSQLVCFSLKKALHLPRW